MWLCLSGPTRVRPRSFAWLLRAAPSGRQWYARAPTYSELGESTDLLTPAQYQEMELSEDFFPPAGAVPYVSRIWGRF